MRKKLVLMPGKVVELSPLSYREWMAVNIWSGDPTDEYKAWLEHNKFVDANEIDPTVLETSHLILSQSRHSAGVLDEMEFRSAPDQPFKLYSARSHSAKSVPSRLRNGAPVPAYRGK